MYIANRSFMVDSSVHEQWLKLLREKFIPFLHEHGFTQTTLTRMLSVEVAEGFTYSLQIRIDEISKYKTLTDEIFPEYDRSANELFGDKVLQFTSLMKIINND